MLIDISVVLKSKRCFYNLKFWTNYANIVVLLFRNKAKSFTIYWFFKVSLNWKQHYVLNIKCFLMFITPGVIESHAEKKTQLCVVLWEQIKHFTAWEFRVLLFVCDADKNIFIVFYAVKKSLFLYLPFSLIKNDNKNYDKLLRSIKYHYWTYYLIKCGIGINPTLLKFVNDKMRHIITL